MPKPKQPVTSKVFLEHASGDIPLDRKTKAYVEMGPDDREKVKKQLPEMCENALKNSADAAVRLLNLVEALKILETPKIRAMREDLLQRCEDQHIALLVAGSLYPQGIPAEELCKICEKGKKKCIPCAEKIPKDDVAAWDTFLGFFASMGDAKRLFRACGVRGKTLDDDKPYYQACIHTLLGAEKQNSIAIVRLYAYLQDAKSLIKLCELWKNDDAQKAALGEALIYLLRHGHVSVSE
jgi:hypothetical protein